MQTDQKLLDEFMYGVEELMDKVFGEKRHCVIILQEGEKGAIIGSTIHEKSHVTEIIEQAAKNMKGEGDDAGSTTH